MLFMLFYIDPPFHAAFTGKLSDVIVDGDSSLPTTLESIPEVPNRLELIVLPSTPLPDTQIWPQSADGKLTTK